MLVDKSEGVNRVPSLYCRKQAPDLPTWIMYDKNVSDKYLFIPKYIFVITFRMMQLGDKLLLKTLSFSDLKVSSIFPTITSRNAIRLTYTEKSRNLFLLRRRYNKSDGTKNRKQRTVSRWNEFENALAVKFSKCYFDQYWGIQAPPSAFHLVPWTQTPDL